MFSPYFQEVDLAREDDAIAVIVTVLGRVMIVDAVVHVHTVAAVIVRVRIVDTAIVLVPDRINAGVIRVVTRVIASA